jgi:hypothetical protein
MKRGADLNLQLNSVSSSDANGIHLLRGFIKFAIQRSWQHNYQIHQAYSFPNQALLLLSKAIFMFRSIFMFRCFCCVRQRERRVGSLNQLRGRGSREVHLWRILPIRKTVHHHRPGRPRYRQRRQDRSRFLFRRGRARLDNDRRTPGSSVGSETDQGRIGGMAKNLLRLEPHPSPPRPLYFTISSSFEVTHTHTLQARFG